MVEEDSKIFPQKLMEILSDPANQTAICWLPHGRAFTIRDRSIFVETVMPRYFSRKAKYSSFTRKLNRWNFSRVSSGPELGAYHHEYFLRDQPHLAAQMFCRNARSLAAMTKPASEPAKPPPTVLTDPTHSLPPQSLPQREMNYKNAATATILERQHEEVRLLREIQALRQQEQANRLLVERALAMQQRLNPMQELQMMQLQKQKLQQERMRQLGQLMLQQQGVPIRPHHSMAQKPPNKRASAA